jgi:hypothetical protein
LKVFLFVLSDIERTLDDQREILAVETARLEQDRKSMDSLWEQTKKDICLTSTERIKVSMMADELDDRWRLFKIEERKLASKIQEYERMKHAVEDAEKAILQEKLQLLNEKWFTGILLVVVVVVIQ